jgi:hypothetical protein
MYIHRSVYICCMVICMCVRVCYIYHSKVTLSVISACHLSVICCYDFRESWMDDGRYVVHVVARACAAAAAVSVILVENMVIFLIHRRRHVAVVTFVCKCCMLLMMMST